MRPHYRALHYMRRVLALAEGALAMGELPIAAMVVLDDQILASATTSERREGRYLVHAELVALEQADRLLLPIARRRQATLYTSLEPCLMCLGAAMSFFIGTTCYALESPGDGAVELATNWRRAEKDIPAYQLPRIRGGILRRESANLFQRYVEEQPPGPMRDWARSLAALGGDTTP